MNLTTVREYSSVKRMTREPKILVRACATPIKTRPEAYELLLRICKACNHPLPYLRWGKRNWARPRRQRLNLRLSDLSVELVLHEFAHLIAPEEFKGRRRIHHGVEFVRTLDLLLVIWDSLQETN